MKWEKHRSDLMKDEYLRLAQERIEDPRILVNLISQRVRQFRFGAKATIEMLERLDPEDIALREIIAGKLSYELSNGEASHADALTHDVA